MGLQPGGAWLDGSTADSRSGSAQMRGSSWGETEGAAAIWDMFFQWLWRKRKGASLAIKAHFKPLLLS